MVGKCTKYISPKYKHIQISLCKWPIQYVMDKIKFSSTNIENQNNSKDKKSTHKVVGGWAIWFSTSWWTATATTHYLFNCLSKSKLKSRVQLKVTEHWYIISFEAWIWNKKHKLLLDFTQIQIRFSNIYS